MQKVTILFGVLLIAVGLAGYMKTGSEHPTALIPCWIGIVLGIAGFLAIAPARRMLWMHVAVTVGLLGFLGTVMGGFQTFQLAHGKEFEHPIAVVEKGATCLLCLLFTALCVRSFIEARRTRVLGA